MATTTEKKDEEQQGSDKKAPGHIPLSGDYKVDGVPCTELNMRRAKVRDLKAAQSVAASDADVETVLFANLCDVPPELINELDLYDYENVQEEYSFLKNTPPGKMPGGRAN